MYIDDCQSQFEELERGNAHEVWLQTGSSRGRKSALLSSASLVFVYALFVLHGYLVFRGSRAKSLGSLVARFHGKHQAVLIFSVF